MKSKTNRATTAAPAKKTCSPGQRAGGPHNRARPNSGHRDQPLLAVAADAGLPDGQQEKMLRDRAFKVIGDHPQADGPVAEAVPDEADHHGPAAQCSHLGG